MDVEIAKVNIDMASIPYLTGYLILWWQHANNTLIPKELGNFRVRRIRTILLYEADFNFNNKLIGFKIMRKTEQE